MNTATTATNIAHIFGTARYFSLFIECPRCAGFAGAFMHHHHVNDGKCFECGGTLRKMVTKPMERLPEYYPDARAESIRTLARVLDLVGAQRRKGSDGKPVSEWGFAQWKKGDDNKVMMAALSIAPADVRARFFKAFTAKVNATMPEKNGGPMNYIRRMACDISGITEGEVGAWLGEV